MAGRCDDEKVDTTTGKVDTTTLKVDTKTQEVDTTFQKGDTTTQKVDTTTHEVDTTTQRIDTTNEKVDTTPQKVDTTPQKIHTTTRKVHFLSSATMRRPTVYSSSRADAARDKAVFCSTSFDGLSELGSQARASLSLKFETAVLWSTMQSEAWCC